NAVALHVRGICAAARNDFDRAAAFLRRSTDLASRDPVRWPVLTRGYNAELGFFVLAMVQQDPDTRVKIFTQALGVPDPSDDLNAAVLVYRSRAWEELGNTIEQFADLTQAIRSESAPRAHVLGAML